MPTTEPICKRLESLSFPLFGSRNLRKSLSDHQLVMKQRFEWLCLTKCLQRNLEKLLKKWLQPCNVSWSHWWDGARITSSEIRASLLLIFVLVSFLCMYHFSLLSEVFGFFVFPSYGHQVLGNIFCFPFWFYDSTFWFSRQLQICTFITLFTECRHWFWFSMALSPPFLKDYVSHSGHCSVLHVPK